MSPPRIIALSNGCNSYINSVALDTVATPPPTAVEATTATLLIIGSAWIAQEIVRDRKKRSTVYHQLLLASSISNISGSLCMLIGSWVIPKRTNGIFMVRGNHVTC